MKICVLTLLLIFTSMTNVRASEKIAQNCESIIQNLEYGITEDFWSYLNVLLQDQIISTSDLERFYEDLIKGKLTNPVEHQVGPQGPLFKNTSKRVPYFQFEKYLKLKEEINLSKIKSFVQIELEKRESTLLKRTSVSLQTNIDLKMDQFFEIISNKFLYRNLYNRESLEKISELTHVTPILAQKLIEAPSKFNYDKGYFLLSQTNPNFNLKIVNDLLNYPPHHYLIPVFLHDDNSQEFRTFVLHLLDTKLNLTSESEILSKIIYTDDKLEAKIKEIIQFRPNDSTFEKAIRLISKNPSAENRSYVKSLILTDYTHSNDYAKLEIARALIRMGEYDFVFKNENEFQKNSYHKANLSVIFDELDNFYNVDPLSIIRRGLQSTHLNTKQYAAKALSKRTDTASRNFLLSLLRSPHTITDKTVKLNLIAGIEEDWALDFIKNIVNNKDESSLLREDALIALRNGKTLKTRDLIEYYYDYKNHKGLNSTKVRNILSNTIEGRPIEDLIYFIQKYHDHFDSEIAFNALRILSGIAHPEVIEVALEMSKNTFQIVQEAGFAYLRSLPLQDSLHAILELIDSPYIKQDVIEALYGVTDLEIIKIIENEMQDYDPEISRLATDAYIYAILFHYNNLKKIDSSEESKLESSQFILNANLKLIKY